MLEENLLKMRFPILMPPKAALPKA